MDEFRIFGVAAKKDRSYELPVYGVALVYRSLDVAVSKYLSKFGLSTIKFNVLMIIDQAGGAGGISQVEISRRIIAKVSNIARLLDRMEREGLIKRNPHPTDRRVNIITNTQKGKLAVDKAWDGYDAIIKNLANRLRKEDQERLSEILTRWFLSLKERS